MIEKKGISLIILIITMIVIMILAGAIILNLRSFSSAITEAQKAKIQSDVLAFKNEMEMHFSQNPREDFGDYHVEGKDMLEFIPSMENKRATDETLYIDGLIIDKGLLKVIESKFRIDEENALKEVLPSYK